MDVGDFEFMCTRGLGGHSIGTGFLSRLRSFLLGIVPELQQTAALTDPSGSCGKSYLLTEDSVDVFLRINIVHQNFAVNGLETGS
eukprot:s483_g17.t1